MSAMRHELKASDGQLKSLSNFFHSHIKLKGEPSYGDTISLVHDHLKTRTFCRLISRELQVHLINAMFVMTYLVNVLFH